MRATTEKSTLRRLGGERGQAMVEFAIIAPLFVALVAGVIQFGVALNYWLDLQRLANQGARWAVVNRYPDETQNPAITCTAPPSPAPSPWHRSSSRRRSPAGTVLSPRFAT